MDRKVAAAIAIVVVVVAVLLFWFVFDLGVAPVGSAQSKYSIVATVYYEDGTFTVYDGRDNVLADWWTLTLYDYTTGKAVSKITYDIYVKVKWTGKEGSGRGLQSIKMTSTRTVDVSGATIISDVVGHGEQVSKVSYDVWLQLDSVELSASSIESKLSDGGYPPGDYNMVFKAKVSVTAQIDGESKSGSGTAEVTIRLVYSPSGGYTISLDVVSVEIRNATTGT